MGLIADFLRLCFIVMPSSYHSVDKSANPSLKGERSSKLHTCYDHNHTNVVLLAQSGRFPRDEEDNVWALPSTVMPHDTGADLLEFPEKKLMR